MKKTWEQFLQALARGEGIDGANFSAQAVTGGVTAQFSAGAGTLSVFGNAAGNDIEVSRDAAGGLLINDGAVAIRGGTPTVANTALIQVFGQGGNDIIALDESLGALPRANLFGGAGNDSITGGSGNDMLFGQSGNDTLLGKGGFDFLFGGTEDDILIGGDDDDQMFGEGGNDRFIWNPGDDTDLMEGGAGIDTAEVNGGGGDEDFTVTANGTRVRFDRTDPAPFSLDLGTTERLEVNMNGGDDQFSATGDLAALIQITVNGGTGNDTILGSNGADLLLGGEDNDFIDGQQGSDTAFLGSGHDVFQWDPGDGSDIVEGGEGTDTMLFNGSGGAEEFEVSANGSRVLFTRNLGTIVMDLNDVESIDLNALGNADQVIVNDLSGTDLAELNVNLAGTVGGNTGDAQADTVIVNGTNGEDIIDVLGAGTSVSVVGLATQVNIANSEGALDSLVINGLGGDDGITATTLPAGVIKLTIDGGAGDDTILGSQGADVLIGGDDNDFVFGDNGDDVAFLGSGDDVFQWNPGDGSDTIEGQDGFDTLLFFGSNANENINILANGARALFFRDIANVTMDMDDVESIDFRALGGVDNIFIGDLSGTDVTQIGLDLRGPDGGGDGAVDTVTVSGTNGDDVFGVAGDVGGVQVFGLQATVNMFFVDDKGQDRLILNGLGGDDVIDASSLEAGAVQLTLNGGLGDDILIGSEGDDFFNGGDGNDLTLMGAGDDTFVWNPGDDNDTLEGQDGFDTMLFNGANVAENITISANGGRVTFFRNIATVTMDLDDVEAIDFNALGGADTIVVNDMTGTDLTEVNIDLAGTLNGDTGDGAVDQVIVNGTNGDDVIILSLQDGALVIQGLASEIVIENFDLTDSIVINGLAGDDVVEASGVGPGGPLLTLNGGDDDDVLIGGDGNDVINGGAGDDVLLGGNGIDLLDGGGDDDIEIQLTAGVSVAPLQTEHFLLA
jgi:Ca2+-binding RTX toxin-like protein